MTRSHQRNDGVAICTIDPSKSRRKGRRFRKRFSFLSSVTLLCLLQNASSTAGRDTFNHRDLEEITYLTEPQLSWMSSLDKDVVQGNAVVQSPFNDDILYVTTHSGSLMVINSRNGKTLKTVVPTARTESNGDGELVMWSMYSNSGISFGTTADGQDYLVYSIVDEPINAEDYVFAQKTRVVAVTIPDHTVMWESGSLPGTHEGSPVVVSDCCVFLTHNSKITNQGITTQTGHISLIDAQNGDNLWEESESRRTSSPIGYGPPGVAKDPEKGMFAGAQDNSNDVVVWTSKDVDGKGKAGHTYAFQLPKGSEGSEAFTAYEILESTVLKSVGWTAVAKPVFNADGTDMFIGVTGSQLRGWKNARFDQTATWQARLFTNLVDSQAAIPTPPVLSNDGSRLFVSTSSYDLAAVNTVNGQKIWNRKGTSTFLSEPRVSPDDKRLYVLQSADGRVICRDQMTGDKIWEASCDQFQEDCSNSIRADFDLSPGGEFLYFSDVKGRIISLRLAEVDLGPNISPTQAPTIASGPQYSPTNEVDWDKEKDEEKEKKEMINKKASIGGTAALIAIALMIASGSAAYIVLVQRRKKNVYGEEETYQDSDDFTYSNDPDRPDPYEDSMITMHSSIDGRTQDSGDGWYSPAFYDVNDAKVDQMASIIGTSNRVAPLKEDFSYGSSILV